MVKEIRPQRHEAGRVVLVSKFGVGSERGGLPGSQIDRPPSTVEEVWLWMWIGGGGVLRGGEEVIVPVATSHCWVSLLCRKMWHPHVAQKYLVEDEGVEYGGYFVRPARDGVEAMGV